MIFSVKDVLMSITWKTYKELPLSVVYLRITQRVRSVCHRISILQSRILKGKAKE
jgi:hypothetical protein